MAGPSGPAPSSAARAAERGGPERRVHAALVRPVLYAGVERPVVAIEASLAVGLLASVGPRLVTFAAVALIVGVVHPVMVWLTNREPMAVAVYARSLRWRDYYPAHGGLRASHRARPTLPPLT